MFARGVGLPGLVPWTFDVFGVVAFASLGVGSRLLLTGHFRKGDVGVHMFANSIWGRFVPGSFSLEGGNRCDRRRSASSRLGVPLRAPPCASFSASRADDGGAGFYRHSFHTERLIDVSSCS